jgi:hypothetical protein
MVMAMTAYPILYNNIISVTDNGMVVLQNSMDSQKDEPGSHSEACLSSPHGDHTINVKDEDISDMEDGEDPVSVTVGIKAEHEVSGISHTHLLQSA